MKTIGRTMGALGLMLGLAVVQPLAAHAEHQEHGGQEHGGSSAAPAAQEHGGASTAATDEATVLRQAADALRKGESRPDLASQLEKLADGKTA